LELPAGVDIDVKVNPPKKSRQCDDPKVFNNWVYQHAIEALSNLEDMGAVDSREEYILIMQWVKRYCETSIENAQDVIALERKERMTK
jgi:hypothetical protein